MRRALESLEFVEACAAGRLEDVRHFLGRGVSVNATKEHLTGLHQACYHGHTDVMEHLLQQARVWMAGRLLVRVMTPAPNCLQWYCLN